MEITDQIDHACPCGLPSCIESWEPGCGLGNSAEHAVTESSQAHVLPPLPAMKLTITGPDPDRGHWYSAEQMKNYARVAIDAAIAALERMNAPAGVELLCQVYPDAYHAGHHATVEGGYIDVLPVDRDTYWREKVEEDYTAALAQQPVAGDEAMERMFCVRGEELTADTLDDLITQAVHYKLVDDDGTLRVEEWARLRAFTLSAADDEWPAAQQGGEA